MVLAVTVLTSMDEADLEPTGVLANESSGIAAGYAALGEGCQGVVTSAREASVLRSSWETTLPS